MNATSPPSAAMYTPPSFPRTTGLTDGEDALLFVLEEYEANQFRLKVGATVNMPTDGIALKDGTDADNADIHAANTARTTGTKVIAVQHIDSAGKPLDTTAANAARTTATRVLAVQHIDATGAPLVSQTVKAANAAGAVGDLVSGTRIYNSAGAIIDTFGGTEATSGSAAATKGPQVMGKDASGNAGALTVQNASGGVADGNLLRVLSVPGQNYSGTIYALPTWSAQAAGNDNISPNGNGNGVAQFFGMYAWNPTSTWNFNRVRVVETTAANGGYNSLSVGNFTNELKTFTAIVAVGSTATVDNRKTGYEKGTWGYTVTNASAVSVTLEGSMDGTNWSAIGSALTSTTFADATIKDACYPYFRITVGTLTDTGGGVSLTPRLFLKN